MAEIGLAAIARRETIAAGFNPDFSPAVLQQVAKAPAPPTEAADLRDTLWSSIDNPTSRDLDQIEFARQTGADGEIHLSIGIADVDAFVPKGSAADEHAAANGFSVYCGVATFPMLPPGFSYDRTSLLPDADRPAVVFDITLTPDQEISGTEVSLGTARNHAKLDYESAGAWMAGRTPPPPAVAGTSGLAEQLQLQLRTAELMRAARVRSGTLEFESIEPQPLMEGNRIAGLALQRKNRARDLIEDFMITANRAIAMFLQARGIPLLQRVLRTPERWPRIVEVAAQYGGRLPDAANAVELGKFLRSQRGQEDFPELSLAIVKLLGPAEYVVVRDPHDTAEHFALAVQDYTHSTAPNRRYPDLVIQRLVKAAVTGAAIPYAVGELEEVAAHCNERAAASRKLERLMRKIVAAAFLRNRIGDTFAGIVTGASDKGTFARIFDPPAEGRIVRGEAGLDVGDKVRVKLLATNPDKGFIDFARSG